MIQPSTFDSYARGYNRALSEGLILTGESRDYFARQRVEIVAGCCARLALLPGSVCDYGCGTGDTLPLLGSILGAKEILGLDVSTDSLAIARERFPISDLELARPGEIPAGSRSCDLVYCNGVFHHIPLADRLAAARQILSLLRPGGCWFFWENNPFNPGTRWVMSRIAFDHDAVTLRPSAARSLGENAGALWRETTYHFYFPRFLRAFRGAERWLKHLPLGGQYLVVLQKPAAK